LIYRSGDHGGYSNINRDQLYPVRVMNGNWFTKINFA
jgi:hypothetical protein